MTALAIWGAASTLSDGHVSTLDVLRLAVLVFATLALAGPLFALRHSLPLPGRRHPAPASDPAAGTPALDRVSTADLMRSAPPDLGLASVTGRLRARGGRALDFGGWLVVAALVVGLAAVFVATLAAATWAFFERGPGGMPLALRLGVLALSCGGLVLLTLSAVRGLRDRRRRRRRAFFQRLSRYGLRIWDGVTGSTAQAASTLTGESPRPMRLAAGLAGGLTLLVLAAGAALGQTGAEDRTDVEASSGAGAPKGSGAGSAGGARAGASTPAVAAIATATMAPGAGQAQPGGQGSLTGGDGLTGNGDGGSTNPAAPGGGLTTPPGPPPPGPQGGAGSLAPQPDPQGAPAAPASPTPPAPAPVQASATPIPTATRTATRTPTATRTRTPTRTPTACSVCPPTPTKTPLGFTF